jgi:hypothetical protein
VVRRILAIHSTPTHIRGFPLEFGIAFLKGFGHSCAAVPEIPEEAAAGGPDLCRAALHLIHVRPINIEKDIEILTDQFEALAGNDDAFKRLRLLEGFGPISAVRLFVTLGSGGKANLMDIIRYAANKRWPAILICGVGAYSQ